MSSTFHHNQALRAALSGHLEEAPPPLLRARVLGRHRRRRAVRGVMAALPVMAVLAVLLLGGMNQDRPAGGELEHLQARAITLEAQWRAQEADRHWLRDDARAQVLLDRLRQIDQALGRLDPVDRPIPELTTLWRERDAALSALIETGRTGGLAVRI